jgi:hypothetical protein
MTGERAQGGTYKMKLPHMTVSGGWYCSTSLQLLRAPRGFFTRGGTGILPMRTAKMAVPRFGCGPAALS